MLQRYSVISPILYTCMRGQCIAELMIFSYIILGLLQTSQIVLIYIRKS